MKKSRFLYLKRRIKHEQRNLSRKVRESKNNVKKITDASWGQLIRKLEYKSQLKKVRLIKISQYYASSQICHKCGYKNEEVKDLKIRNYECPECKNYQERDINAAINIMLKGIEIIIKEQGYQIIAI